jgi:radical SAM protein with 4Fe4S-binding SPASM domain
MASAAPELTTEQWYAAFDGIKELGTETIIFTGGEPLMRKDVLDLARYANSIGLSSQLMTNATLITEKNFDEVIDVFGGFALSLDSHVKDTNDFLRGRGAYDKTVRVMRMLQERERTFTIAAVITRYNVWDLPGLHEFALKEFGCNNVYPAPCIPNTQEEAELLPPVEDYNRAMEQVAAVAEKHYGSNKRSLLEFHGVPVMHDHCGAAIAELSIDADGSVYPCSALHKPEFRGGNVTERSLVDIYRHSPVFDEIRGCTIDKIETCRDCEISNACGGGCRALAYNLHGSLYSCNTFNCDYLRSIVYNGFWHGTSVPIEELKQIKDEKRAALGR